MTLPPSIQTKNKKEKGEIRRGEESQNKKRWERRCVEVKRREGQGERERRCPGVYLIYSYFLHVSYIFKLVDCVNLGSGNLKNLLEEF